VWYGSAQSNASEIVEVAFLDVINRFCFVLDLMANWIFLSMVIWFFHFQIKFAGIRNLPFGLGFWTAKKFWQKGGYRPNKKNGC
jgi:hypothetical protein